MNIEQVPDHILTRAERASSGLWYAVLNLPPGSFSWLDFSTCADTEDAARAQCATKIRDDARGIGKFAPHAELTGYSLYYKQIPYWQSQMEMTNE